MRLKYDFEKMDLNGQTIAVPVGEKAEEFRGVVRMNETATYIFELLKNETTEDAIVDELSQEYNADRALLAQDVKTYIQEFRKKGLLME